MEPSRQPAWAH